MNVDISVQSQLRLLRELVKDPMLTYRDLLREMLVVTEELQRLQDVREMQLRNPETEIDLTGASAEFLSELIQRCSKATPTVATPILFYALRAFEKHPDRATFTRKDFFPPTSNEIES